MERMQASISAYSSFPLKAKQTSHLVSEQEQEINIFDAERYFSEGQEKEFKKAVERKVDAPSIPRFSSASSMDGYGRNYRTKSFNATPTASSEASWNSQSGLLTNPPGSIAVSMRNMRVDAKKKKRSSGSWLFGRRCPCSGKKSVLVKPKCSEPQISSHLHCNSNASLSPQIKMSSKTGELILEQPKVSARKSLGVDHDKAKIVNSKREEEDFAGDSQVIRYSSENSFPSEVGHRIVPSGRPFGDAGGFSFPILNPPPPPNYRELLTRIGNNDLEEPPRESLEVFHPMVESLIPGKTTERRGQMPLRKDMNHISHQSLNFLTSSNIRQTTHTNEGVDDGDVMSDASSDLFEIESFSTQSTMYPMYRRRDSLDEQSSFDGRRFGRRSLDETTATDTMSVAPTECYEPSEASIDWSVTTAEGFGAANMSSSVSEYQYVQSEHSRKVSLNATNRRGSGGLLTSCRCEKAVNVGPHPVSFVPDQHNRNHHRQHQQNSYVRAQALPVESGRARGATRVNSTNIPRSHSARMPRSLATH